VGTHHHGGGRRVLGGEDVAAHPPHVGSELRQRLDQHRRLHRHVQASHHPGAGQGLAVPVALAQRHQARHLVLGQADLLAAEVGEVEVGDLERNTIGRLGHGLSW
jgi:hypothetical protein